MRTSKKALVPLAAKSVSSDVTNAPQRLAVFKDCDIGREQWEIADIQTGLQEADRSEFASAEELRVVYAKYGH